MADWRGGSPQGSPTPSLEGALREAVSFRAGSPGFRGVLPLAQGGTEQEPASEKPLRWGRGWGGRVGSMWEPRGPPAAQVEQAPGGDVGAKAGRRRPGTGAPQKAGTPSLQACPLLPHKGQKGTWGEIGPCGEVAGRSGCVLCPQSPMEARRCAEGAGAGQA